MRFLFFVGLLSGCNVLFPEFSGNPMDMATNSDAAGDGGTGSVHGTICVLTDITSLSTCAASTAGYHIGVEETREVVDSDGVGNFILTQSAAVLTIEVVDKSAQSTPTVVRIAGGTAGTLVIPMVSAQTLSTVAYDNGITLDDTHGSILVVATNSAGTPLAGVQAQALSGAAGPLYEAGPNAFLPGSATGNHGSIAWLNVTLGDIQTTVGAGTFTLPVRASALTFSLLQ
jgi:hypothetical protein